MSIAPVSATVYSDIGFYIGDVCYVLPDKIYNGIYGGNNFEDGVYEVDGFLFAVGSTAYGDGVFMGEDGNEYGVDAGNIGIVPIELISTDRDELSGRIVAVPGEADFSCENGVFWIDLPTDEQYSIDTREQ